MKHDDAQSGILHFELLLALAQGLQQQRITIYRHEWHSMVFGSWSLIAGTRHRGYLFSWDGREGFMSVQGPFHVGHGTPADSASVANEQLGIGPAVHPLNYVLSFFQSGRQAE